MTQETIIEKTIELLKKLPLDKASEVSDFAEFLISKYEDQQITKGIQYMVSKSEPLEYFQEEQAVYTAKDLKEKF